ncbi:MAG: SDR family oxidoreductase [Methylocella sp.]
MTDLSGKTALITGASRGRGDVGAVVAFLASDAARWITGDTLRVDGGYKL